ncbi:hypothetical protein [Natronococcus wangiae]|uniref:hypothetical protein n=1 Tax=Natronococcus wangiae TaxID=3068275 RepID=UPI00273E669D|nr:hypothetical protein [Natronococcus sp. AD5]
MDFAVEGSNSDERAENLDALKDELEHYDDTFQISGSRHDGTGQTILVTSPEDLDARNHERLTMTDCRHSATSKASKSTESVNSPNQSRPKVRVWPSFGIVQSTLLNTFGDGVPEPNLVAFDGDMVETPLRDSCEAMGVDDLSTLPDISSVTVAIVDTSVDDGAVSDDADDHSMHVSLEVVDP